MEAPSLFSGLLFLQGFNLGSLIMVLPKGSKAKNQYAVEGVFGVLLDVLPDRKSRSTCV